jgi:hypothetical protein
VKEWARAKEADAPHTWNALMPTMRALSASEKEKMRHSVDLTVDTCEKGMVE